MKFRPVLFCSAIPFFSSLALASLSPPPPPPVPKTADLSCEFETPRDDRWLRCKATIQLCDIQRGPSEPGNACQDKVDVDCNNGFDLDASRHVRADLDGDDLKVFAERGSKQAQIDIDEFTNPSVTKFPAELSFFQDVERWTKLRGHCKSNAPVVPPGSCQPSSSLSVLVNGTNVVSYVPKGHWEGGSTGVSLVNVEGTSVTNTRISTPNVANSCASNPVSGQTVCTANNSDVYLFTGSTLSSTLTSAGTNTISFSGGSCTNCGVAMDATHNKAIIGLSLAGKPGFQFLNLAGTPAFETAFASPSGLISEDPLIDPIRNLVLSPSEGGNYEIVNVTTSTAPAFFERATSAGTLDSAGEDCSTGIALAPAEFSGPSSVFIADLTQATFTAGTPSGTWAGAAQTQSLSESNLSAGASGIAVAQGTHIGVISGEFGGNTITAITLPATSGSGTPAITDWVTCGIPSFSMGFDPHTLTAYQSPNGGDAIALLVDGGAANMAVVDLTMMLNTAVVPRTAGGHACASGTLPTGVVKSISIP